MRLASRAYIDKEITDQGGGEHSRVIDSSELDPDTARSQVEALLEPDEVINQIVQVQLGDEDPVI